VGGVRIIHICPENAGGTKGFSGVTSEKHHENLGGAAERSTTKSWRPMGGNEKKKREVKGLAR